MRCAACPCVCFVMRLKLQRAINFGKLLTKYLLHPSERLGVVRLEAQREYRAGI